MNGTDQAKEDFVGAGKLLFVLLSFFLLKRRQKHYGLLYCQHLDVSKKKKKMMMMMMMNENLSGRQ